MAKKMIVRYNGGTQYYYPCTKPDMLVKGREYEVIHINMSDCHTEYTLKGVEGEFNSVWFDVVEEKEETSFPTTYLATSHNFPVVGRSYVCSRIEWTGCRWILEPVITSTVMQVEQIADSTYRVITRNSVYITEVQ